MSDRKKVLIINGNESIISLFKDYLAEYMEGGMNLKFVNENPPNPIITIDEAVKKIKENDFDVLIIGHKLSRCYVGLDVLRNPEVKNILKDKLVISDGYTPGTNSDLRFLYRKDGRCNHFINRETINMIARFSNLMFCLENKCDCESLP